MTAGTALQLDVTSVTSMHGRVAVVTGGATGIGLATSRLLASAGATVVVAGLATDDPAAAAAQISSQTGSEALGVPCDVTAPGDLERLIATVRSRYGRLDTVVCNAGLAADETHSAVSPDGPLDQMFNVHVRSVIRLANQAIPVMVNSGGGSFVVISSIAGLRGNRTIGLYGVTKAANAQIARNLAVQWGHRDIRANAVSPGVIATEFAATITRSPTLAQKRLRATPLQRFGEPAHVASTVLWLCSPGGGFVSGQNIVVDGGTLIGD